jgi:hypothetical protein
MLKSATAAVVLGAGILALSPTSSRAAVYDRAQAPSTHNALAGQVELVDVIIRRVPRVVVVRPYRAWVRRPHYGSIIAGVVLGTIVAAAVAGVVPPPPRPDLCWYWADRAYTRGYWDYC